MTETLSETRMAEIRELDAAATPGPWVWRGNVNHDDPRLVARGRDVLGVIPWERSMDSRDAREVIASAVEHLDMTEAEAETYIREHWLVEDYDGIRRDGRLGFVGEDLTYSPARELAIFEVCPDATSIDDPRVYRADITGLRNRDATFIAAARQAVTDLLTEVDALRAQLVDARKALVFADGNSVVITGHPLAALYADDCTWAQDALAAAGCHARSYRPYADAEQ